MAELIETINANPYLSLPVVLWVLVWKGIALWKAARHNQKWWFIALLVINTLGLLEILYIFVFSKLGQKTDAKPKVQTK
ncbi:MAG TPA: DUF5652 family protein [bacterium]|jgi:hypothetical protein|nr:DUF5652 family protein [bacterium]HNU90220.1 DUF5652 family protein [bacterium]HPX64915.1 DUF5652 family protein [bacterium]